MQRSRLAYLLKRTVAQNATAEEAEEFCEILRDSRQNESIKKMLMESWLNFTTTEDLPVEKADKLFNLIWDVCENAYKLEKRSRHW